MARDIKLPQLGQTMEEGTIVNVLVTEGDEIKKGDVIFEVETDKATLEVESPAAGFVKKILVEEGQTIPVNTATLIVGDEHEEIDQAYIDSVVGGAQVEVADEKAEPVTETSASGQAETAPADASLRTVRLPQLGQTMEEGTIVNVLVNVGDEVSKGDVIFEVETDKATLEMESPAEGFVKAILVEEGETIPVNDPLVVVGDKDSEVSQAYLDSLKGGVQTEAVEQPEQKQTTKSEVSQPAKVPQGSTGGRIFASPRAKMLAEQHGIDLRTVATAPGALRVVAADVLAALQGGAGQEPAGLGKKIPVNRLQKITGQKMLQSKRDIPCFYLTTQVDMTELVKFRAKANEVYDVKISFNDYIIRAVARALRHYPVMTGQLAGDYIQLADRIHVGLAIAVEDGLISPVIKDADQKDTAGIAAYSKKLVERTRGNQVTLDDLEGGCSTISNLGGFGIHSFIPVVVPGQCSILGVGAIEDTCVPSGGNILVRKMMALTLSVDHKVANGAEAAQFLDYIKKLLEHPAELDS